MANEAEYDLTTHIVEDHGYMVMQIPSFNLSAYGNTLEEARDTMESVIIPDYCESQQGQLSPEAIEELRADLLEAAGDACTIRALQSDEEFQNLLSQM